MSEVARRSRRRLVVMVLLGAIAAVVVGLLGAWPFAFAAGWAVSCAVYIIWIWLVIGRMDPHRTRQHATAEDPSRGVVDLLVLAASIASLVDVVVILVTAHAEHGVALVATALLAIFSVGLSWGLVHTVYTLRYAGLYYTGEPGGIDFNQKEEPAYADFAYVSFTLGMTYQVSDTDITTSTIRAVVLRHTLLSYLFGAVIVAATVNLVAGLGG